MTDELVGEGNGPRIMLITGNNGLTVPKYILGQQLYNTYGPGDVMVYSTLEEASKRLGMNPGFVVCMLPGAEEAEVAEFFRTGTEFFAKAITRVAAYDFGFFKERTHVALNQDRILPFGLDFQGHQALHDLRMMFGDPSQPYVRPGVGANMLSDAEFESPETH